MAKKDTNPKDAVGVRKWRQFTAIPMTVMAEVGVGMLEGARKYGRHNYRVAGVRASVYVDAAMGHVMQWWEGEDKDPDSGLSHVTKAICSLVVLRDAMIEDMLNDDRPPKADLHALREDMQNVVDRIFEDHPEPRPPHVEKDGGVIGPNLHYPIDGAPDLPRCRSARDGECEWRECPQERDREPSATGRHCPYDAVWSAYREAEDRRFYSGE